MKNIKKIQLKDEQALEKNSTKNPRRLPPTGNSTGKEYTSGANVFATAEVTIGNYHWAISVGTYATANVTYIKNPDTGYFEFHSGTITIGTTSFTATGGDPVFEGTKDADGNIISGVEYNSLSTNGSLGTQMMIHIYNLPPNETINIPIALIGVATIHDSSANPPTQYRRDVNNVELQLGVGFNCDPYTGISGISLGLSVQI